jgi:adenosylhomocysteine nucleosidase
MDMPKFGIVAALEREVEEFTRKSAVSHRVHDGNTVKVFERGDTVLVCGGIGRHAARRATEALIALCNPETVQSVGYAGALTPALKIGELIRPARITDSGDGSSLETGHGHGILVTANCTATAEQKRRFAEMYRADAVDMEAAAVAKGAEARGIRFSAMKVISDSFDFDMPPTDQFVTSEGQFRSGRFVLFAALRPWVWGSVATLAKNSKAATRVLCQALEKELIERSSEVVPST